MKSKNLYILVTQKQLNWYDNKLLNMGVDSKPWVHQKIAAQGYDNSWFKGVAVATKEKLKGFKCVDFRYIRNDLWVWTKKFYNEVNFG